MLPGIVWLLLGLSAPQSGQTAAVPAIEITDAALVDVVKQLSLTQTGDVNLRVVDIGNARVGVGVVRRLKPDSRSLMHTKVTEVYVVKEGSATIVTGGTAADPQPPTDLAVVGPTVRGGTIQDGTAQHIGPGDVVIIPPGTPHSFTQIDGPLVYLIIRVDPEKVIAVK